MIHVAYRLWGGEGFFAKMLGTSMLSMFENTKEKVTVHIMHNDRLTADNRDKFCYIAGQYNQQVEFHNVEEISGPTLRKFENVHPDKTGVNSHWYPLIVHEVFPDLDKIICLGADTVFNEIDIGELWAYDLGKYGFAAAVDIKSYPKPLWRDGLVKPQNWFNVDVLIIKPSFMQENFETILNACKFIYDNKYYLFENDALNYLFSENYLKLPYRFNSIVNDIRRVDPPPYHLEKAIYHYAGPGKPNFNTNDVFNKLFFEYFLKTPWANAEMFGNLNNALEKMFKQIQNNSKINLLHFANLLSERSRAFLCEKNFQEPAHQIFAIKPDELMLDIEIGIEKIVQELNEKKGSIILFVMIGNYLQVRNFLLSQNFVEGVDFVNGFEFLSERHGLKFNFDSRSLVQAL